MDYNEIRKIIQDMGDSKLDTLEIEFPDGLKIKMDKGTNETSKNIQCVSNDVKQSVKNVENLVEQAEEYNVIKSPMVGTFYSRPAPNKDAFAKTGDTVKKGQVICIVEAMKLMNEIESEFDGEIAEICVKDGDVVEYGTPLFKIK